jgi:hypothetical protein
MPTPKVMKRNTKLIIFLVYRDLLDNEFCYPPEVQELTLRNLLETLVPPREKDSMLHYRHSL